MPFFRFLCKCGADEVRLLLDSSQMAKETKIICECGLERYAARGTVQSNEYVTGDEDRNRKYLAGVQQMLTERSRENYRRHELPRIIAEKGEQYAKENKLVDEDGKSKV